MSEIVDGESIVTGVDTHEQFLHVVTEFLKNPQASILICVEDAAGLRTLANTNSLCWLRGAAIGMAEKFGAQFHRTASAGLVEEAQQEVEGMVSRAGSIKKGGKAN